MEILCYQYQFTGSAVPLEKAHPHASKTAFLIIGLNILASHPIHLVAGYCENVAQYCEHIANLPPKTHCSWVFAAPAVCAKEVTATSEVFATRSSSRPTAPVWLNIYQLVEFLQT